MSYEVVRAWGILSLFSSSAGILGGALLIVFTNDAGTAGAGQVILGGSLICFAVTMHEFVKLTREPEDTP